MLERAICPLAVTADKALNCRQGGDWLFAVLLGMLLRPFRSLRQRDLHAASSLPKLRLRRSMSHLPHYQELAPAWVKLRLAGACSPVPPSLLSLLALWRPLHPLTRLVR